MNENHHIEDMIDRANDHQHTTRKPNYDKIISESSDDDDDYDDEDEDGLASKNETIMSHQESPKIPQGKVRGFKEEFGGQEDDKFYS